MAIDGWRHLRWGDVVLLIVLVMAWLMVSYWSFSQPRATRVRVYQDGKIYAELDLMAAKTLQVAGPLGHTVIEVAAGKARIAQDPSPRQYCVRAGWLQNAGQSAIRLPNRTSIELIGNQPRAYDSLNY